jgi:DNA-binding transcriptional LysR family regulator
VIDWSHLPFLLEASRAGSLAAAARALDVDPATVGRHVTALEKAVGAKLLRRKKGGGLEVTEAGAQLLAATARTEEALLSTVREVRAQGSKPTGVVRVTTVEILATTFVAPRLPELASKHPDVTIDMIVTPQVLDLSRQVDVALRLVRPSDDALVTKRAGSLAMGVYAPRALLEKHPPTRPGLPVVAYGEHFSQVEENAWLSRVRDPRVMFRTTSVNAAVLAVASGLGAGMLPVAIADQRSELVRVPSCGGMKRDVWLAMHPDLAKTPRVRVVADFLCRCVSGA